MYGIELTDNIIVAAGSVVTKSFLETNIIIGGNPARKIGTWGQYYDKYYEIAQNGFASAEAMKKEFEKGDILVRK